jgi:hypothetical protein
LNEGLSELSHLQQAGVRIVTKILLDLASEAHQARLDCHQNFEICGRRQLPVRNAAAADRNQW